MHSEHSRKPLIFGFVSSILLTLIALWIGIGTDFSYPVAIWIASILAVIQMFIQLFYFMHVGEATKVWNYINIGFSIFIAITIVGGSIWIMAYHSIHFH